MGSNVKHASEAAFERAHSSAAMAGRSAIVFPVYSVLLSSVDIDCGVF